MLTPSLRRQVPLTLGLYALGSTLVYGLVMTLWGPGWAALGVFAPVNGAYHGALWVVLLALRNHAISSQTGEPLHRLGLANSMTLLRLSLFPTLLFLFVQARAFPEVAPALIILTALSFLTDLLDGWLSRKLGQISNLGKILDSSSDYFLLTILTMVFLFYGLLPVWLFVLIAIRMGLQTLGMMWITWKYGKLFLHTTLWGKISFFALMVLYTFEILLFFEFPGLGSSVLKLSLEIASGVLTLISIGDKIWYFRKQILAQKAL